MRFPLKQLNVLFAVVVVFATAFATAPLQTRAALAASGVVKILMIGFPDQDSIDALTGDTKPGIGKLEAMFEKANPTIDLQIINIPWGSGATGYAPKTEAMIQAQEACVYMMPGAFNFGQRGYLENLDKWIKKDSTFKDVWPGDYLEQWRGWGPGNPDNQWALPYTGGNRVIHYDAVLFKQWGVEPLSQHPTLLPCYRS